jgi:hypothetical protein
MMLESIHYRPKNRIILIQYRAIVGKLKKKHISDDYFIEYRYNSPKPEIGTRQLPFITRLAMRKFYLIYPTFSHFQFLTTALHSCVRWRSEHLPHATFSGLQTCCEWPYDTWNNALLRCLCRMGQFGRVPKIEVFWRKRMFSLAYVDRWKSLTFSVVCNFWTLNTIFAEWISPLRQCSDGQIFF